MAFPIDATSVKIRFPEFRHQDDARVQFAIEEASLIMDATTWMLDYYVLAFSYLAAHYLMVAIQREQSGTNQQITSERIGSDFSVTYAQPAQPDPSDRSDYNTTDYGIRFVNLMRLNFPAVAIC